MSRNRTPGLASLIESFFTRRLLAERQASPHTVGAYRDTFRLLLSFAQRHFRRTASSLEVGDLDQPQPHWTYRCLAGGMLMQEADVLADPEELWQTVTDAKPSEKQMIDLRFAWELARHVKSNAILLAQGEAAVGIGGGLPSRVDAVRLAVAKAGEQAHGAVLASDAFFPFPDGVELAADAGVTAIVQPGGSVRDQQVIETADRLGLAMCFTGMRHFRH